MDSTRQVIRWSIPGLVSVTVFLTLYGILQAMLYGKSPVASIAAFSTPGVIAVLFGGIPVGFLIYQLYYAAYRSSNSWYLPRRGKSPKWTVFLRADRGALVIMEYLRLGGSESDLACVAGGVGQYTIANDVQTTQSNIKLRGPLKVIALKTHICALSGSDWRRCVDCRDTYDSQFILNWRVLQTFLDLASARSEFKAIKEEYTSGSDLYHALGATRRAVTLASIGAVVYAVGAVIAHWSADLPDGIDRLRTTGLWVVLVAAIWATLWLPLTRCRRSTDENFRRRTAGHLSLITREFGALLWKSV